MKNIHVLPTDKPSRLIHNDANQLCYQSNNSFKNDRKIRKKFNIYIINLEEIKEGDWVYCLTENRILTSSVSYSKLDDRFKIILTTDGDLIRNGVQAINDEFLEWFVKNPSCEGIDIETSLLKKK